MKLPPVKLQKETEQIQVSVAENIILREMAPILSPLDSHCPGPHTAVRELLRFTNDGVR